MKKLNIISLLNIIWLTYAVLFFLFCRKAWMMLNTTKSVISSSQVLSDVSVCIRMEKIFKPSYPVCTDWL